MHLRASRAKQRAQVPASSSGRSKQCMAAVPSSRTRYGGLRRYCGCSVTCAPVRGLPYISGYWTPRSWGSGSGSASGANGRCRSGPSGRGCSCSIARS
eukprot:9159018-Pyramimonas_sp.AAC.1